MHTIELQMKKKKNKRLICFCLTQEVKVKQLQDAAAFIPSNLLFTWEHLTCQT